MPHFPTSALARIGAEPGGIEGTGLNAEEFARYQQQRRDFDAKAQPVALPIEVRARIAGIAAECDDPDTTDALDDLLLTSDVAQQAAPAAVAEPMTAHRAAWFLERFKHEAVNMNKLKLPARRYFLVTYSWSQGAIGGTGNLWFGGYQYPSNTWIKQQAQAQGQGPAMDVVVTNIIEMSAQDFEAFQA